MLPDSGWLLVDGGHSRRVDHRLKISDLQFQPQSQDLWPDNLDSIVVSVFVVILVEFDDKVQITSFICIRFSFTV